MRTRIVLIVLVGIALLSYGTVGAEGPSTQKPRTPVVRNMEITGEIAKSDQGYIIRGKKPAEIFTILNPVPAVLDAFVKTGKTVRIMVRIVSGDNVNIELIDGKPYDPAAQKPRLPVVRNMDITGEIAKADQGYIIRGKKPSAIFTILNPDPTRLDEFINTGKSVHIKVRVVSGDNIEIEMIEGKAYGSYGQTGEKKGAAPL